MKRIKLIGLSLILCLGMLLTAMIAGFGVQVYALSLKSADSISRDVESLSYELFGDVNIDSVESMYNLDGSPDYIYVDFEDGYAVFAAESLELLEYSPQDEHQFENTNTRKYYGGPQNHLTKVGWQFVNSGTGESFYMPEAEAKAFSQNVRQAFSVNKKERTVIESESQDQDFSETGLSVTNAHQGSSKPPIDELALIQGTNALNVAYIDNAQYFAPTDPTYGYNEHNTCGSVAAQLLLGYNNYYNDRRIISPEYLNGGWNNATGNGNIYDPANYALRAGNPNVCVDPMSLTWQTAGTNDDFYNQLISAIEPGAFNCVCTDTSITIANGIATVTVTVTRPDGTTTVTATTRPAKPNEQNSSLPTEHSHSGSSLTDVRNGLRSVLNARGINHTTNSHNHNPASIKAQIDAQRPVILLMQKSLGGINHFVVGYGYGDYTYHAGETYSGYIVHFGWTNRTNIWINSSWCDSYISLQVNHTHNYNATGNIINGQNMELRCSECGHRIVDGLFNVSGNTITGAKYNIAGSITIPSQIEGQTVTTIGSSAFADRTGLTGVTIPARATSTFVYQN